MVKFFNSETKVPGPGQYNPKNEIDGNGKLTLSTYKSPGARSFPHGNRITLDTKRAGQSLNWLISSWTRKL